VRHDGTRRGFALAAVLAALVVIGALVAGGFFVFLETGRLSRSAARAERALGAAERGADSALALLDTAPAGTRPLAVDSARITFPGGSLALVAVTALDSATWWVVVTGAADTALPPLERRINVVAVRDRPALRPRGALTLSAGAELEGVARVDGAALVPDEYASRCPAAPRDGAGAVAGDRGAVTASGAALVLGAPPILVDSAAGDTARAPVLGAARFAELAAWPDAVLDTAVPALPRPAGRPFPRLLARGNLSLGPDAAGAGLLLVDGNLTLAGPFRFDGVIVVRGALHTVGDGIGVRGAVFARSAVLGTGSAAAAGDEQIRYAPCLVSLALDGASRVVRERRRGWMDMPW
jgi:hypothetical protein